MHRPTQSTRISQLQTSSHTPPSGTGPCSAPQAPCTSTTQSPGERQVRHEQVDVSRSPRVRQLPVHVNDLVERKDNDVVRLDDAVEDPAPVQVLKALCRVEHHLCFDGVLRLWPVIDAVHHRPARRVLRHHHHVVENGAFTVEGDNLVAPDLVQHLNLLDELCHRLLARVDLLHLLNHDVVPLVDAIVDDVITCLPIHRSQTMSSECISDVRRVRASKPTHTMNSGNLISTTPDRMTVSLIVQL